jgi:dipeptidyl aminopeptidase/acylaminoacyl peptidase
MTHNEQEERMLPEPLLADDAPWKQRFKAPSVRWTTIAHLRPERGLACSNRSGSVQLHTWDVKTGELRQLTDKPEGLFEAFLSPDGRHVYYLSDEHGDETGHWVRIPYEGGEPEDITPDLPRYSSWHFGLSRKGNVLGFVATHNDVFHVYCVDLNLDGTLGERREIYRSRALSFGPVLSSGGEVGVVMTSEGSGQLRYTLVALDGRTGRRIADLTDGPDYSAEAVAFSPLAGDFRVLGTSNRSGEHRPLIWNPRTGEREDLSVDELSGEVIPICWSPDATQVLVRQTHQAVQRLLMYDVNNRRVRMLDHPAGVYGYFSSEAIYFADDGEIITQWEDASHPAQTIALDAKTGKETRTVLATGDVPPGRPWRSVTFPSSDGETIQAWLLVPDGKGPFPAILHTHGGPEAVFLPLFLPGGQMWADHGFAFLSVNYRGSTTFGREFLEKIWYHPGIWEVEDMAAGRQWLVESGIALPDSVFVTGRSYGGYNTLQALGTKPELWAGGMAGVAVADWFSQFDDESEAMRGVDIAFMGGTPEEKPDAYRAASPITYCEQVQAPVVIIQGKNDTRCPARQVELYEARMKELGKPVEVHWYDSGHFTASPDQAIHHEEIFLRFVYRVLAQREPVGHHDAIRF